MKIALFFGSFNPVHIGHVALANYVAEYGNVDKVMMIVSPLNPLKAGNTLLPNEVRLNMLRKAVKGTARLRFQMLSLDFQFRRTHTTLWNI